MLTTAIPKTHAGKRFRTCVYFGPRLGLNIDLTRDGKTLLKMAYGRANEVVSLLPTFSADATYQTSTWQYTRGTGRFDRFVTFVGRRRRWLRSARTLRRRQPAHGVATPSRA